MLSFKHVTKMFNQNNGLYDCSWNVYDNSINGLIGKNGCGKTTCFNLLSQLIDLDSGEISYNNKKVPLKDIGYVLENRCILPNLTVVEFCQLVCQIRHQQLDMKQLNSYLDLFNIKDGSIEKLSKGNQQVIQIISILLLNTKIIMLDEPFNGLDDKKTQTLVELLLSLKKEHIILVAFHQKQFIKYCDQVISIKQRGIQVNEEPSFV